MRRSTALISAAAMIGLSGLIAAAEKHLAEEMVALEISAVADIDIAALSDIAGPTAIADLAFVPEAMLAETPAWLEDGAAIRRVAIRGSPSPTATISIAKLQPELWRWPKRVA